MRSGDGRALHRSGFLDLDLKLICPNGSTSGRIFDDQTMLRTMQDLTRLRQRRNSFITVVLIITLIVIIWAGATVVNQGDTPTRSGRVNVKVLRSQAEKIECPVDAAPHRADACGDVGVAADAECTDRQVA